MRVLAIMGSPRKKSLTLKIVQMLEEKLKSLGEAEFEYIFLREKDIRQCAGCMLCFEKGEEFCPFQDETLPIFGKMMAADGVIIASPNYSLQVPALTKNLLDRLAFVFHRPCFFNKAWMPVVTEAVYGKKNILRYLNEVGQMWGFSLCPGVGLSLVDEQALLDNQEKIARELERAARRFHYVMKERTIKPSLKMIAVFRVARTLHSMGTNKDSRDYCYWMEQGWFEQPFYCEVNLNLFQRTIGSLVEKFAASQARKAGIK